MTLETDKEIIEALLTYEHRKVAFLLEFINHDTLDIDNALLFKSIGLIDKLSRLDDDYSRKVIITLSAILWTYQKDEWDGLKDFLILVLSRIGFPPSSIMIDTDFDKESNKFTALTSLIDEISVAIHQFNHEVQIQGETFLLTSFQKNIWEKIDSHKFIGISAPTSAGKSFIIALKAIDLLLREEGAIIYIVPTLSLVSQVAIDFRKLLKKFQLDDYEILNSYNGEYIDSRKIFVLTQEKAIGAFSQSKAPYKDVKMLVVDEVQNIERVADQGDERAKTLYDLLVEFRHSTHPDHIIISGPRIEKIGNLGMEVFGEVTEEEDSKSSPVASLTYAISKNKGIYYIKQYSELIDRPQVLHIENSDRIAGIGQSLYTPAFHDYLAKTIIALGHNSSNIIFSPTAPQARKTALAIAKSQPTAIAENLESLIKYLADTVHTNYDLCNTLKCGVAYHHGKLPHHVRRVLEKAISEKITNNVVCTTTLMQGVNLPAQNVIIRNPNLYVKRMHGAAQLTPYEIANLRGRAGRLLKDFLGRTFVLDENAFEEAGEEQGELFEEATKELRPGYGEVYLQNQDAIEEGLLNYETPVEENKEYSFLLTYIRQSIIRHGEGALRRFKSVNIELDHSKFRKISQQLSTLDIPIDICMKNRYWDPIDLNNLFLMRKEINLLSSPTEMNLAYKLKEIISFLKEYFPVYYKRYFDVAEIPGKDMLLSMCINAEDWLKEQSLKKILNTAYHNDSDKIDKTINNLQQKISYGLPMLLSPIYDIKLPDNAFLNFIRCGAYHPVTRRLIEYNIPRETAIYLAGNYLKNLNVDSLDFDRELLRTLKRNYNKLGYWVRAQLEALI